MHAARLLQQRLREAGARAAQVEEAEAEGELPAEVPENPRKSSTIRILTLENPRNFEF